MAWGSGEGWLFETRLPPSFPCFLLSSFLFLLCGLYLSLQRPRKLHRKSRTLQMGSGRQKGGVTCTWLRSRTFLGLAELQGALPQAGFSTTVLSLLPWLGVKELTGQMGDTCFPCQLDDGGQTRVGRGPLSVGTDFCPQQPPGHIRTQGERTSLSHPAGHGSSILPGVICKGANSWAGRESGRWLLD